ncbi:MAG: porin family protein, partial [Bacteroidia bacterium]|nr:porin family protein [Bacteroidia bacterium]
MNKLQINKLLILVFFGLTSLAWSQPETNQWKFQFALGVNSPIDNMESDGFEFKSINFPSINLGLQHMLTPEWGAKLDFSYTRSGHDDNSPEFKLNYTRINLQAVYDFNGAMNFLPRRM